LSSSFFFHSEAKRVQTIIILSDEEKGCPLPKIEEMFLECVLQEKGMEYVKVGRQSDVLRT
jgi:hypothetical protein